MSLQASRVFLVTCWAAALSACQQCPPTIEFQPNVPQGGRAMSLAVHPNDNDEMLVASETGGLFRTTDGGATWRHLDLFGSPFARDVAYAPNNPSVVIATTGGRFKIGETGIWISTNGGGFWAIPPGSRAPASARCSDVVSAHGIAFAPDSDYVFVGTDCGLAVSDDLGLSWKHIELDPTRPPNGDKTQNRVLSVLAQNGGKIIAAGQDGIWRSNDNGVTWQKSSAGPARLRGVIHGLAASPYAPDHLFLAHRSGDQSTLYLSTDSGDTWTQVKAFTRGWARPIFVQTVTLPGAPSGQQRYRVYFGEGVRVRAVTFTHHATNPSDQDDWSTVPEDHADPSEFAIHSDGATPLVLATDGGVHRLVNGTWTLTGAGWDGYNALQVTEVTGQEVSGSNPHQDLYYATQDNSIRGSHDGGTSWPHGICCEGFFLRTPPRSVNHSTSKVTGVKCGGCTNFITDQHLQNLQPWPNAPDGDTNPDDIDGNPFPLPTPGHYIQQAINHDADPLVHAFKLTTDYGATWAEVYTVDPAPKHRPIIAGPPTDPYIYQAVKRPGTTPDGYEKRGLKQIRGVYSASGATVADADVAGLGSIGIFPTMFAWYSVFGADPWNPNHLIAADVETDQMKYTYDGGQTWSVDDVLTNLVTDDGTYRFRFKGFPMATTIKFDPYGRCHILVGTVQSGILRSTDGGLTWERVEGSNLATNVSSFYFPPEGPVYVSTYGRGLWKLKVGRPGPASCLQLAVTPGRVRSAFVWDVIERIERAFEWPPDVPGWCPECSYIIVRYGQIKDLQLTDDAVSGVTMAGGFITQFDARGQEVELEIPNAYDPEARSSEFAAILDRIPAPPEGPPAVRGIVVEGRQLRGLILSQSELPIDTGPVPDIEAFSRFAVAGTPIVEPGGQVTVYGTGFSPTERDVTTVISVDGQIRARGVQVAETGRFRVTISIDPLPGSHEIVVEQRRGNRLSRVSTTVLFVPGDEPGDEESEGDRPRGRGD